MLETIKLKNKIKKQAQLIKVLEKELGKKYEVEELIKNINKNIKITKAKVDRYNFHKRYNKNIPENGLFLMFSDQHIEKCIHEENIGEHYDFDIAKQRYEKHIEDTINCPLQSKNLIWIEGGDLFDGVIHTNYYTNYTQDISTIMYKLTQLYLDMFEKLYGIYEKIDIHATYGNHDRFVESKTVKHGDSFAKIFWLNLKLIIKQSYPNITINFYDSGFGLLKYNNTNICLTHGHLLGGNVKTLNTPTRMEKLKNVLRKLYPEDSRFKHIIVGHFHSPMDFTNYKGGKTIVCGSLTSTDGYAFSLGILGKPSQLIMFLDPTTGDFTYINHNKL